MCIRQEFHAKGRDAFVIMPSKSNVVKTWLSSVSYFSIRNDMLWMLISLHLRIELQFKAELIIKGFDEQGCLMEVFACL